MSEETDKATLPSLADGLADGATASAVTTTNTTKSEQDQKFDLNKLGSVLTEELERATKGEPTKQESASKSNKEIDEWIQVFSEGIDRGKYNKFKEKIHERIGLIRNLAKDGSTAIKDINKIMATVITDIINTSDTTQTRTMGDNKISANLAQLKTFVPPFKNGGPEYAVNVYFDRFAKL